MAEIFSSNDAYSTTRRVTKTPSEFEGVLRYPESIKQGGLRTKGLFKRSGPNKPLISVVTVVYNGVKCIEETIKSVINQTYDNIEYIVIDGGSTDGTLDIIAKYSEEIDYWISQSDSGIYNAMNKGIDFVSGIWVNFMNCGDTLIVTPAEYLNEKYVMFYGSVRCRNNKVISVPKNLTKSHFSRGMPVCHQSCFYRADAIKDIKYDDNYKICADQKLTAQVFELGEVSYVPLIIAHYDLDGISSKNTFSIIKEKLKINRYFGNPTYPIFVSVLITVLVKIRYLLLKK